MSHFSYIVFEVPKNENVNTLKSDNPLFFGYFADPTVKKFGDTYYIYATTDGVKLASGKPQVWISEDFVNWYDYQLKLALPEGLNNSWGSDVFQSSNGKYYYYMGNCEMGYNIYGYFGIWGAFFVEWDL